MGKQLAMRIPILRPSTGMHSPFPLYNSQPRETPSNCSSRSRTNATSAHGGAIRVRPDDLSKMRALRCVLRGASRRMYAEMPSLGLAVVRHAEKKHIVAIISFRVQSSRSRGSLRGWAGRSRDKVSFSGEAGGGMIAAPPSTGHWQCLPSAPEKQPARALRRGGRCTMVTACGLACSGRFGAERPKTGASVLSTSESPSCRACPPPLSAVGAGNVP